MYLSGYLEGPIKFRFPDNHEELLQPGPNSMPQMAEFFGRGGIPKRDDNSNYLRSTIFGGELFDGCPVNVILDDGRWLPEQVAAVNADPQVRAAVQGCRYFDRMTAPAVSPPLPAVSPPLLTQTSAPTAAPGTGESLTRGAIPAGARASGGPVYMPTGVATPTVITVPGGGAYIEPATPAPAPGPTEEAGMDWVTMALLAGAAVFFLGGQKKRRA